jgi:tetratricopeptide (TPR) repeat protein
MANDPNNNSPSDSIQPELTEAEKQIQRVQKSLKSLKSVEDYEDQLVRSAESVEDLVEAEKSLFDTLQKRLNLEMQLAELQDNDDLYKQKVKELGDLKKALTEYNKALAETQEQEKVGASTASTFAKSVGLVKSNTLDTAFSLASKGGLNNAMKGFGQEAMALLNPVNLASNAIDQFKDNVVNTIKAIDQLSADARKTYGSFGKEVSRDAVKLEASLRKFNMGTEEAFKIETQMADSIGGYREMTDAQQKSVGEQIAAFERLGVSTEDSAALFQNMVNIQGKTSESAARVQRSLLALANKTGVPLGKIAKVLKENSNNLALYGKNANKIGSELAVIEERTKMSASSMVEFSTGLMSLERSSEVAGDLNAILGSTYISADKLQRLAAKGDVTGVYNEIGSAIERSGLQIDELRNNAPKLQSMAQSLGMSNEELLKALDSYEKGEYDRAKAATETAMATELTVTEMNNLAKDTMSNAENLEAFSRQFNLSAETLLNFNEAARNVSSTLRDNVASANSFSSAIYKAMDLAKKSSSLVSGAPGMLSKAGSYLANTGVGKAIGGVASKIGSVASSVGGKISGGVSAAAGAVRGGISTAIDSTTGMIEFLQSARPEAVKVLEGFTGGSAPIAERLAKLAAAVKSNATLSKAISIAQTTGGKFAKFVPWLGAAINIGSGVYRYYQGDIKGSLYDLGGAAADLAMPGVGAFTAAFSAARDLGAFQGTAAGVNEQAYGGAYAEKPPQYADGTGGFVKSKTPMMIGGVPSIVGESGVEMVMTEGKLITMLQATIKDTVEAAIGAMSANGVQNSSGNAKIELILNSEVLKSFILKTVGRELNPLVP